MSHWISIMHKIKFTGPLLQLSSGNSSQVMLYMPYQHYLWRSRCIFEYALKYTFILTLIKPPIGMASQCLRATKRMRNVKRTLKPHPSCSRKWDTFKMQCDTQRERELGRALTKEGAATLTNGRFKFRVSAVSQTLRAPCERRASRSPSLWREQRRGMEGKREAWSREKEGGEKTEEETRAESLRSPVALTRLFPAETLGPLPPTGPQTSAEWKISVEHPGNDPNTQDILKHTNTRLHPLNCRRSCLVSVKLKLCMNDCGN